MGVYLGEHGHVELRRNATGQALITQLDPFDVNVERRRFSVDFSEGVLITGDQVTIATRDGSNLELVAGHAYPDWRGYIFVDEAGGLRLYDNFASSLSGSLGSAIALIAPQQTQDIAIQTRDNTYNCLANITSYELTTTRDTVNTDVLGQEFHTYYEAGLISGQGRLDCFWEHVPGHNNECDGIFEGEEFPVYLARLVIRLKQGAAFDGRFYIYGGGQNIPAIWYDAKCIVTNVAVNVTPTQIITTNIQFVTTGTITLNQGMPPRYLLQEDGVSQILQEDGSGILLEDED